MSILERLKKARVVGAVWADGEYVEIVGVSEDDRDAIVAALEAREEDDHRPVS